MQPPVSINNYFILSVVVVPSVCYYILFIYFFTLPIRSGTEFKRMTRNDKLAVRTRRAAN